VFDPIAQAILRTVVYADVFDYALTREELHRYLIGACTSRDAIKVALDHPTRLNGNLSRVDEFVTLPQHENNVATRLHWRDQARPLWRAARFYAHVIAHLPFVRMIAVSGGLAMDNARDHDIDLLIVTVPGRLWLVRGLAVALVRFAHLHGVKLCPNFLITENALVIPTQDLYNAHEIVQMVPLYGLEVYHRMYARNGWVAKFLPNAYEMTSHAEDKPLTRLGSLLKQLLERSLSGALGDRIESWEMNRKIRKLSAQIARNSDTVLFSPDACRGFLSGHGKRVLKDYYARLQLALNRERAPAAFISLRRSPLPVESGIALSDR
jgi:hypothetical protein